MTALHPYRVTPDGPLAVVEHDRPGWICVRLTYDRLGALTHLHRHAFDHWMTCISGAALVEIDGDKRLVQAGERYLVERGKAHGVVPLSSDTVLLCEHEIRAENGALDPDAFSPDGIPVEWIARLTEPSHAG
jgi:mannose-6-phosphate isomerase-like protein (cupin superfamily)